MSNYTYILKLFQLFRFHISKNSKKTNKHVYKTSKKLHQFISLYYFLSNFYQKKLSITLVALRTLTLFVGCFTMKKKHVQVNYPCKYKKTRTRLTSLKKKKISLLDIKIVMKCSWVSHHLSLSNRLKGGNIRGLWRNVVTFRVNTLIFNGRVICF